MPGPTVRRIAAMLSIAAPLAAPAADDLPALTEPVAEYQRRAAATAPAACAEAQVVALPLAADGSNSLETSYDPAAGTLHLNYRMAFNDVTEGWNWHPEEPARGGDYYRYKFLPLASAVDELGSYRGEDKIGAPQEFRIRTRSDYFFAFDNPYDFYARDAGDEIGFAADVALPAQEAARLAGGDLRMALRGRLSADCLSSSTTFWKATAAAPVDYTLKKRYLVGRLLEVWFYDAASGRAIARLAAGSNPLSRAGARRSPAGDD